MDLICFLDSDWFYQNIYNWSSAEIITAVYERKRGELLGWINPKTRDIHNEFERLGLYTTIYTYNVTLHCHSVENNLSKLIWEVGLVYSWYYNITFTSTGYAEWRELFTLWFLRYTTENSRINRRFMHQNLNLTSSFLAIDRLQLRLLYNTVELAVLS